MKISYIDVPDNISYITCQTPIGEISVLATDRAVKAVVFGKPPANAMHRHTKPADAAVKELLEYFGGRRRSFDVTIDPGGTPFQKSVWKALLTIPYGETQSYKQIAEAVGNPKATRAVGMANNRNPIPIIIPCHRVIGADGSLVGYSAGLGIKEALLKLEKNYSCK